MSFITSNKNVLKTIESIQQFKLKPQEIVDVYPNAIEIPQFLKINLKADNRIIKEFIGDDAIIKAFYFNFMKLAFEIENQEKDYLKIFKKITSSEEYFSLGQLEDPNFSDQQYRNFMLQFFSLMEEQELPDFQNVINQYPIIDEILLKIFKKIVPITLMLPQTVEKQMFKQTISFLTQKFEISLENISNCFKMIESDIFIYPLSRNQVYLVFIDQLGHIKQVTQYESSQRNSSSQSSIISKNHYNSEKKLPNNKPVKSQQSFQSQQKSIKIKTSDHEIQSEHSSVVQKSIANSSKQPLDSSNKKQFSSVINLLDSKKAMNRQKFSFAIRSDARSSFEDQISLKQNSQRSLNKEKIQDNKINKTQKQTAQEAYYTNQIDKKNGHKILKLDEQPQELSNCKAQKSSISSISHKSPEDLNSNYSKGNIDRITSEKQSTKTINNLKNSNTISKPVVDANIFESKINNNPASNNSKQIPIVSNTRPFLKDKDPYKTYTENNTNNFQKDGASKYSSQIVYPFSKLSKLEIFSKFSEKPITKENIQNDESAYNKFTDSAIIEELDVQFQSQIKRVKQKYREQKRGNIRKLF